MRILIIDQCSGSKAYPSSSPTHSAEEIDEYGREGLLDREESASVPARNLYSGRQQKFIDTAVNALRTNDHEVERYYISAGFGLVEESLLLPPYEVTFNDLTRAEVEERAEKLGIFEAVRDLISTGQTYDLVFTPLGSKYYRAMKIETVLSNISEETSVVVFNQEELAERYENVLSIPARTPEAKEHGTIVVALKGRYIEYFAERVANGAKIDTLEDIEYASTTEFTTQAGFDEFS